MAFLLLRFRLVWVHSVLFFFLIFPRNKLLVASELHVHGNPGIAGKQLKPHSCSGLAGDPELLTPLSHTHAGCTLTKPKMPGEETQVEAELSDSPTFNYFSNFFLSPFRNL